MKTKDEQIEELEDRVLELAMQVDIQRSAIRKLSEKANMLREGGLITVLHFASLKGLTKDGAYQAVYRKDVDVVYIDGYRFVCMNEKALNYQVSARGVKRNRALNAFIGTQRRLDKFDKLD